MSRRVVSLVVSLACALSGCSEYVDRRETLTSTSGEAVARNLIVHTIDPWPIEAFDARIADSGQRAARAVKRYRCGTVNIADGGSQTNTVASFGRGGATIQSETRPTTTEVAAEC